MLKEPKSSCRLQLNTSRSCHHLCRCPPAAQVATVDSVVLYSTDSLLPLAVVGQLHYDSITDLAWSSDGTFLAVSSRDCYCR